MNRDTDPTPSEWVPEEWNFATPKGNYKLGRHAEKEACMYYEYARESPTLRAIVEAFRPEWEEFKKSNGNTWDSLNSAAAVSSLSALPSEVAAQLDRNVVPSLKSKGYSTPLEGLKIYPLWWYILWPEWFPNTPWNLIPENERSERRNSFRPVISAVEEMRYKEVAELLNRYSDEAFIYKAEDPNEVAAVTAFPWQNLQYHVGSLELYEEEWRQIVVFRINWSRSNETLVKEFTKWLRSRHRPVITPLRKSGEKSGESTALRQLAIMRILHNLPWSSASADKRFDGLLRTEQGRSIGARKDVKKRLQKFFQWHTQPDEHPLNFSTWSKRKKRL